MANLAETLMRTTSLFAALLLVGAPAIAFAQDTTRTDTLDPRYDGWLPGAAIGVPGYGSLPVPEAFTVAMSFTKIRPNRVGPDIWIGTMPRAFEFAGVLGARVNASIALPISGELLLVPTAGLSAIGAFGDGGGGALAGVNGGASVIVESPYMAWRFGITAHRFSQSATPVWLMELGFLAPRK